VDGSDDRIEIGPYTYVDYTDPRAIVRPWDARAPAVAARLVAGITAALPPGCAVEHIGSTAIPGCDGKGVIDLMVTYPPGGLVAARDAVDALGFQRHALPGAFGEERPARIGSVTHDGDTFQVHAHVIAADDPEVARQRHFRDTLRADPALIAAYVADKRRIAASGVARDGGGYADAKDPFIRSVNERA
jgi:GrpB-like predicted nucleotidyltransferase (UPF0157 family)